MARRESNGEAYFAGLLRTIGRDLPAPEPEYHFDPTRRWRMDFAWIEDKVCVEIDGGNRKAVVVPTKHGIRAVAVGRHTKPEDIDKCNEATAQGWRVLHFTPEMLENNPDRCIDQVRRLVGLPFTDEDDEPELEPEPVRIQYVKTRTLTMG